MGDVVRLYEVVSVIENADRTMSVVFTEDNTHRLQRGLPLGINTVGLTTVKDEARNYFVGQKVEITMKAVEP